MGVKINPQTTPMSEEIICVAMEHRAPAESAYIGLIGSVTVESVSVCFACLMPALPSHRETQNTENMASTEPDTSVDISSADALSECSTVHEAPPQSILMPSIHHSLEAGATENPPSRRKRPRHPRARGGRRIQEARARKAARVATQEAAAADVVTQGEVAGATAKVEADTARIFGGVETDLALPEPDAEPPCAFANARAADTLAEAQATHIFAEEAHAEAALDAFGEDATVVEAFHASPHASEVHTSTNERRTQLTNDAVDPVVKKRRRRQRRNRPKTDSEVARSASASDDDQGAEVGADEDGSGSAEHSIETISISASVSTSSSFGSFHILSQPPTPPLGTLRAWPSEPFLGLDDSEDDNLPCSGPPLVLKEPEVVPPEFPEGRWACNVVHTALSPLLERSSGQSLAVYLPMGKPMHKKADVGGLFLAPGCQNAIGNKIQSAAAPSPSLSRPLYLRRPQALDTSLASNAHRSCRLASPTATLLSDACPHPRLSPCHYALLQTLFPDGDPRTQHVHEPLPPQPDISPASEALIDVPSDTLAHDLLTTHKEISGLKGSMAALLARMNHARTAQSLGATTKQASHARKEARAVRVLRSLLKDMEGISVLTVRLAAAVQSDMVSSTM